MAGQAWKASSTFTYALPGLDYASDITTYEKRYRLDRYVTNVNQFYRVKTDYKHMFLSSTSVKKNVRLNPSDLVDKLAMFISGQIEEKRLLGMKLKDVIEKGYDEYKTANRPRITNLKEIAPKQCCHYNGETKYSTKFQRWVNTNSVTYTLEIWSF